MKVIEKEEFKHTQIASLKTGELYSLSSVVSKVLGSTQIFAHHDIIGPGQRSSGLHRHTLIEEFVLVLKGTATVQEGAIVRDIPEGSIVIFEPNSHEMHTIINKTERDIETLSFSLSSEFDRAIFDSDNELEIQSPSWHFDQHLRDVPDNRVEWITYVEDLKSKLKSETHPDHRLKLFEHIGMASRILGDLHQAEFYLSKSLAISQEYPVRSRYIQNLIRLAHVFQWKKDFEKSQVLFDQAKFLINEGQVSLGLQAAYHQHLGKLYFDQELFRIALAEFSTALRIRQQTLVPEDQIFSSRLAVDAALGKFQQNLNGAVIRKAILQDAEAIHTAHMKSIQELCFKDYTKEEIQAWGFRPFDKEKRTRAIKEDFVSVIEINNKIEGYGYFKILEKSGIRVGHILGLYLTPTAVGKNLGKGLLDLMTEELSAAKIEKITLQSTKTALNFYRKAGFVETHEATQFQLNEILIPCFSMEKVL